MLIGFALVAVPLLFAVINSAAKMRRLADQSAALVRSGVQTTHYTQQLFQQIATMERSARLYQVLNDPSLLKIYRDAEGRFQSAVSGIEKSLASESPELRTLKSVDGRIAAQLATEAPTNVQLQDGLNTFGRLSEAAGALSDRTSQQIEAGLAKLQIATAEAQQYLFWQTAGLIVLTAVLLSLFTSLILQPIRQIDQAISQLGKGTFSRPIAVRGPSDLVALGQQLEWLRIRLLEIAQERNRFLRHMSHELKTPLANIREGTELLTDGAVGELDSAQREVAGILRDNSIKLQQLIENLLSFSAWQARHSGLEISEFRLRPLIKTALETHQLALLAQRLHLELKVQDVELRADRAKLKLILDNLLSNAIKYSPRGGTIFIHARSDEDQVILDVGDTGPGIPDEERTAIFEAFYSGRAPISGHLKGTGIGLSVVSEFVQAHGGTIEIVDGTFPGAHFRIRLPLAPTLEGAVA